ncbi:MAG TPA: carbamoyltransferase HypF [Leptolyngbyaceae cyanobacterium]
MSISPFTSKHSMGVPKAEVIRLQGTVQGVELQQTVYRLAKHYGLKGEVCSDGTGIQIVVVGGKKAIDSLVEGLRSHEPALAHIQAITREPYEGQATFSDFNIIRSHLSRVQTLLAADRAMCDRCLQDIQNASSRHYRYPFTSCAHCGPRLSIIQATPYNRARTSMRGFPLCSACYQEYEDVENRRFQAQTVACPICGPVVWLEQLNDSPPPSSVTQDEVDAVCTLLQQGEIVAIKGLGGFHLACDATNEGAVRKLRQRKHGAHKPLALMARSVSLIERYCRVGPEEKALLTSAAAPIVLLEARLSQLPGFWLESEFLSFHRGSFTNQIPRSWEADTTQFLNSAWEENTPSSLSEGSPTSGTPIEEAPKSQESGVFRPIAPSVAPKQPTLGFMLPHTPLHHLILQQMDRPIVLTSGNLSGEPQCTQNEEAKEHLSSIADYILLHNQDIINRVDDSVVRVCEGHLQTIRRARGYAPMPISLPEGFQPTPSLLAMGSELRNTFCLVQDGQAVLSQHIGNLENAGTYRSYRQALDLFSQLLEHHPEIIAVDQHPDYLSTQLGLSLGNEAVEGTSKSPRIQAIQHHHAHVAACMAENGLALKTPPILGIALDSSGFGDDGTLWGGEFLLADYRGYRRLATFKPVALLGGEKAVQQPWRNTYAHFRAAFDWAELTATCSSLELFEFLSDKSQLMLDEMLEETHSPLASSVGRLFDAVAAALGICREGASYEGQGAVELEALVDPDQLYQTLPYPFDLVTRHEDGLWVVDPQAMWLSLLADLMQGVNAGIISARFHVGLANAIATLTHMLRNQHPFSQVALTGGVFQNKILLLEVKQRLEALGLTVLTHSKVPPNDGGLSLGQAVIAAARHINPTP